VSDKWIDQLLCLLIFIQDATTYVHPLVAIPDFLNAGFSCVIAAWKCLPFPLFPILSPSILVLRGHKGLRLLHSGKALVMRPKILPSKACHLFLYATNKHQSNQNER